MPKQGEHGISWCEETWNPVTGCSRVSEGCRNCYAETMAHRFQHLPKYAGTTRPGGGWSGQINFDEKALLSPLRRRKPTVYFVNSMSDLFHENVKDDWIDRVFAAMALCPQHRFLILTKRAERMKENLSGMDANLVYESARHIGKIDQLVALARRLFGVVPIWPLPNVGLGVSVENQATADERILLLLETPAAMRFVSYEPALGPVDLYRGGFSLIEKMKSPQGKVYPGIDWIIAGGESGPGARPAHPDWFRYVRDQCQSADVPFHFKQWGEWAPSNQAAYFDKFGEAIQPFGDYCETYRVGKKNAGRLLDDVEHLDRPEWFFQGGHNA